MFITLCRRSTLISLACTLFLILSLQMPPRAGAQTIQWTRQFGTIQADAAEGAAVDGTGIYVVGSTSGSLPGFQNQGVVADAFVRKYNTAGTEQWTRQFGTIVEEELFDVATDATAIYVVGYTRLVLPNQPSYGLGSEDLIVRKYDAAGNELWTRQYGSGGDDRATGVAADASGIYVVGSTGGALAGQDHAAGADIFIRKYDSNGLAKWTREFGTTGTDLASEVAVDATGVYVTGQTNGTLPGQTKVGQYDIFVRKYDLNGTELWTRQFGSTEDEERGGVATDSTGVYVSGETEDELTGQESEGGWDAFIRKYDTEGNELWTRQFGTNDDDEQYEVAADGTGVFIVGDTADNFSGESNAGLDDAYVRKYSFSGTLLWTKQFGSEENDLALGLAVDGSGLYVVGSTDGELPGEDSAGGADAYLIRMTSPCVYSISATSQDVPAAGGSGSVGVTTATGCAWTATSSANFVSITSGSSGSGNGTVNYTVAANTNTATRNATLTIAGLSFTVNQAAAAGPPPPAVDDGGVVSGASFAPHPAPLAPGTIATIFGTNLTNGSSALTTSFGSNGRLVTTLAGAQVTVNGVLAPMFFATPTQLAIQIPVEVAGQTSATLQVSVGSQTSASRTIFVDSVSPGIFTINLSGAGAGVFTHLNGSLVSQQNPARPDEIIVMYATGLGALNPPLATGAPSTGNETAVAATLTVDGLPAQVLFSGTTPGLVGLNQINFRIPASTRTANNIPVVLSSGAKQSNSVTIPVAP